MIEVVEQVRAAHRQVTTQRNDRGDVRSVIIRRTYDASVSDVWDACTNPERIARWLLPVSGDLCVGGRYQLEGNAGGVIDRCESPTSFSASWEFGGEVTWIEFHLAPQEDNTTLFELIHTVPADDKWREYGPGAVGPGWDLALVGLADHLLSRDGGSAIAADWTKTAEGIQCVSLSSKLWNEANLAGGADPADARAAANRTTKFWCAPAPDSVNHVGNPR